MHTATITPLHSKGALRINKSEHIFEHIIDEEEEINSYQLQQKYSKGNGGFVVVKSVLCPVTGLRRQCLLWQSTRLAQELSIARCYKVT